VVYYHLHPIGQDSCTLERDDLGSDSPPWLCPGCLRPRPGATTIDVQIQERSPGPGSVAFLTAGMLLLARRAWLEELCLQDVMRDLHLGTVVGDGGRLLPDWATVNARHRIIVRGSEHATCRTCDHCQRAVYFAMGRSYLYPEPHKKAAIYCSDLGGLLVPENVINRKSLSPSRTLGIEKLNVVAKPLDGFDVLVR
jgi:hypothetical protein